MDINDFINVAGKLPADIQKLLFSNLVSSGSLLSTPETPSTALDCGEVSVFGTEGESCGSLANEGREIVSNDGGEIDSESLIQEIRKLPCLWDTSDPSYKDRNI